MSTIGEGDCVFVVPQLNVFYVQEVLVLCG